ncbi:hypothetical protein AB0N17_44585, partial [Streptomyces sp. NPDC051133]
VAQLYAADVPEIAFPEGTDLVQILWCPEVHGPRSGYHIAARCASGAVAALPAGPRECAGGSPPLRSRDR